MDPSEAKFERRVRLARDTLTKLTKPENNELVGVLLDQVNILQWDYDDVRLLEYRSVSSMRQSQVRDKYASKSILCLIFISDSTSRVVPEYWPSNGLL